MHEQRMQARTNLKYKPLRFFVVRYTLCATQLEVDDITSHDRHIWTPLVPLIYVDVVEKARKRWLPCEEVVYACRDLAWAASRASFGELQVPVEDHGCPWIQSRRREQLLGLFCC